MTFLVLVGWVVLTQVMVVFFCVSLTLMVFWLKVNPYAASFSQPFLSPTTVVAMLLSPSPLIVMEALTGALENLYKHLAVSDLITKS